ncbi:MAG: rhodanese-like domain-containing protein [Flavobacteriales bacterium]
MKFAIIGALVVIALLIVSCSSGQNKPKEGTVAEDVNVEQFQERGADAQLLDVRTPGEWNEGIIEGAIMSDFYEKGFEASLATLDKEKAVYVYCRSGGRSGKAMAIMNKLGFKEVYNLAGGIGAWNQAAKPTVKP